MNDKELLEAAAKAAEIKLLRCRLDDPMCRDMLPAIQNSIAVGWNPLTDDGDALRLAVKLGLQVTPGTYNIEEATAYRSACAEAHERVHFQQDIGAATRRAIVRAAAAMAGQG